MTNLIRDDQELLEYLVDKLIDIDELDDAARWAQRLQLEEDRIPSQIVSRLLDLEQPQ